MVELSTKEENCLKYLNYKILSDSFDKLDKDDFKKNTIDITESYGIYSIGNVNKIKQTSNSNKNVFEINIFRMNDIIDIIEKLYQFMELPEFFGSIALCKVKNNDSNKFIPYNIMSMSFIDALESKKIETIEKVFYYSLKNNNNLKHENIEEKINEIYNHIIETYSNISNISIKKDIKDDSNFILNLKCKDRSLEQYGIHLDRMHIVIDSKNNLLENILRSPYEQIINSEFLNENELMEGILPDNWTIELSVIQDGIIFPSYGLWSNENGRMITPTYVTNLHPNISSCGGSYCTGNNLHKSITGISELSYGNLNSALNSKIGLSNSLQVAKAYQKMFMPLLLELEV